MTDRPILFSAPMVRALLEGRKTQTRRLLKPQPDPRTTTVSISYTDGRKWMGNGPASVGEGTAQWDPWRPMPYVAGDRLWVREAWKTFISLDAVAPKDLLKGRGGAVFYEAGGHLSVTENGARYYDPDDDGHPGEGKYRPGMHAPRWMSRITLTVTDVRVQRLQEISPADAIAEGIRPQANSLTIDADTPNPVDEYRTLWDSLNAKRAPWASNPWIVAVTFDVATRNIDRQAAP